MDDFESYQNLPYSEETTRVLSADDLSLSYSLIPQYIATPGPSQKGRKASEATNILRLFCKSTSRLGKPKTAPPKLEYLRAFFNRFERRLVRAVMTKKSLASMKKRLAYNLPGFKACCDSIKQNLQAFEDLNLADNVHDPVNVDNKHSSFNEGFTKEFYSLTPMRELHAILVHTIFSQAKDLNAETFENCIEEFLKMSARNIETSKHESLRRLECLLNSQNFTAIPEDEDLQSLLASTTFHLEVPHKAVEIPIRQKANTIVLEYDGLSQIGSSGGMRVVQAFGL